MFARKIHQKFRKKKIHQVVTFHVYAGAPLSSWLRWKFAHLLAIVSLGVMFLQRVDFMIFPLEADMALTIVPRKWYMHYCPWCTTAPTIELLHVSENEYFEKGSIECIDCLIARLVVCSFFFKIQYFRCRKIVIRRCHLSVLWSMHNWIYRPNGSENYKIRIRINKTRVLSYQYTSWRTVMKRHLQRTMIKCKAELIFESGLENVVCVRIGVWWQHVPFNFSCHMTTSTFL